jgi:hypothetical protein
MKKLLDWLKLLRVEKFIDTAFEKIKPRIDRLSENTGFTPHPYCEDYALMHRKYDGFMAFLCANSEGVNWSVVPSNAQGKLPWEGLVEWQHYDDIGMAYLMLATIREKMKNLRCIKLSILWRFIHLFDLLL